MQKKYILAVDVGTTSAKALLYDDKMKLAARAGRGYSVILPDEWAVEQDPFEILEQTVEAMRECVKTAGISPKEIAGMGLAVQRNAWTYWDRKTGIPIMNTAEWSDGRGYLILDRYKNNREFMEKFPGRAYEIGSTTCKSMHVLQYQREQDPALDQAFLTRDLCAGTTDTWLLYNLTGKKTFATSRGMACVTSYYHFYEEDWDWDAIDYFRLKREMMARILPDAGDYGTLCEEILGESIPIRAVMADQSAALFGEGCLSPGEAKCTWGTGSYISVNCGENPVDAPGILSGVAWQTGEGRSCFLEGSNVSVGSTLEWMKHKLGLIRDFDEMNRIVKTTQNSGGVTFTPGLYHEANRPFSNTAMMSAFMGVTASARREHFVRAVFEGILFTISEVILDLAGLFGEIPSMRVNGGISKSDFACQTVANVVGSRLIRGTSAEATAFGAAGLCAVSLGRIRPEEMRAFLTTDREFTPDENAEKDKEAYERWRRALACARKFQG